MTFDQILTNIHQDAFSQRDKGNRFERLMQAFLLISPLYKYTFQKVWLWNEFPFRAEFGKSDLGIDLVGLTHSGDFWAIQCKCYDKETQISKDSVDTFIATSGRSFKGQDGERLKFAHRLWISTTNNWSTNATETLIHQDPPVNRISLHELQESTIDWAKLEERINGKAVSDEDILNRKRDLFDHQKEALNRTHAYFQNHDRGKLIMACGTGKAFTALRIAEYETNGKGLILFLVPSIALLGQTLREWAKYAQKPLNAICICSDPEVSKKKSKIEDSETFSVVDLARPASTNVG